MNIAHLISELKRRRVFRAALAYLIAAWGLSVGAVELLQLFEVPNWITRALVVAAFLGFPVAMIFAWKYDFTSEGLVRDRGLQPEAAPTPAAEAPAELQQTLVLQPDAPPVQVAWSDGSETRTLSLTDEFTIGRDPTCAVNINNPAVSRQHAKVWRLNGQWIVEDLGSQNGTLVQGEHIERRAILGATIVELSKDGPKVTLTAHALKDTTAATLKLSADELESLRSS